jgi:hypothetical protein
MGKICPRIFRHSDAGKTFSDALCGIPDIDPGIEKLLSERTCLWAELLADVVGSRIKSVRDIAIVLNGRRCRSKSMRIGQEKFAQGGHLHGSYGFLII